METKLQQIKEQILLEDEEKPQHVPPVIYDRNIVQTVPMEVPRGDKTFNVSIDLSPISDEDFFKLQDDIPQNVKRVKTISVELFAPHAELGRKLAAARHGFKERPDWREATDDAYFINAVKAVLDCSHVADGVQTDDLLDDDAEIKIPLKSAFNGKECFTAIFFREETKDEMDEYFAIVNNLPQKGVLASAKKISPQKRLFALYQKMTTRAENYAGNDVPAWHAITAVEAFLLMQFGRVGKLDLG